MLNIMRSKFLNLNFKDFSKGLIVAVLTAVITYLYEAVQTGDFTAIDWKTVGFTALSATIAYLMKNLVTNSDGEVATAERKV